MATPSSDRVQRNPSTATKSPVFSRVSATFQASPRSSDKIAKAAKLKEGIEKSGKTEVAEKINELYHQSVAFHLKTKQSKRSADFIATTWLENQEPRIVKLVNQINVITLGRLNDLNIERPKFLGENFLMVPMSLMPTLEATIKGFTQAQMAELDKILEEGSLDKLKKTSTIESINTNLIDPIQETLYLQVARAKVEDLFQFCFSDEKCLIPNEYSLRRKTILDHFEINSSQIKELVLQRYIELCEVDPITNKTCDGLVECLQIILKWYSDEQVNRFNQSLFILSSKALALTLECLLLHISTTNLSAQKKDIQSESIKVSGAFQNINIHKFPEVEHWATFAKEASIAIQTESSVSQEVIEQIIQLISVGTQLANAVANPAADTITQAASSALTYIIQLSDKIHFGSSWFKDVLALRTMMRAGINDTKCFTKIVTFLRSSRRHSMHRKKPSTDRMHIEPLPSEGLQMQSSKMSDTMIFFILENLQSAILKSPHEKIRADSIKLLIHFVFLDRLSVQKRVIKTLQNLTLSVDVKTKNSAFIILEFLATGFLVEDKEQLTSLRSFLEEQQLALKEIDTKSKLFPVVLKYFLNRALDIRQVDISGNSFLNLLPYSNRPIDCFLPVFRKIPCLTTNHRDFRGRTFYHHAAWVGNSQAIASIRKSELRIPQDTADLDGDYPIHAAIRSGNYTVLRELLKAGADPMSLTANSETALHLVMQIGSVQMMLMLEESEKPINYNAVDSHFKTPMNHAIESDFVQGIEHLISKNATIAESKFKTSPMTVAAQQKKLKALRYFVDRNIPDIHDMCAIFRMVCSNRSEITINHKFLHYLFHYIFKNPSFHEQVSSLLSIPHPQIYISKFDDAEKKYVEKAVFNIRDFKPDPNPEGIFKAVREGVFTGREFERDDLHQLKDTGGFPLLIHLTFEEGEDAFSLLKRVIKLGGDIHEEHPSGITPYILAKFVGNVKVLKHYNQIAPLTNISVIVRAAIDQKATPKTIQMIQERKYVEVEDDNLQEADSLECTTLMYLASHQDPSALNLSARLSSKVDVNKKNRLGTNALIAGVAHGNQPYVVDLLNKGARINDSCSLGLRPVHVAAAMHNNLLNLLDQYGADFDCMTQSGENPLHLFCGIDPRTSPEIFFLSPVNPHTFEKPDSVTSSKESGVNIEPPLDPRQTQELTKQAQEELDIKLLDLLLKKIDPFIKDGRGNNALTRATLWGKPHVIAYLLEKYPKLFWDKGAQETLPIRVLLDRRLKRRDLAKLKAYDSAFLDLNPIRGPNGETMAHLAASAKLCQHFKRIIENDKEAANTKNKIGQTPLHEAAKVDFHECLDCYKDHDLKLNPVDHQGNGPLHLAALEGNNDFIRKYVALHPDSLNQSNLDKRLPIHLATLKGHLSTVQLLIELGSTTTTTDFLGDLPIHLASRYGNLDIFKVLFEKSPASISQENDEGLNCFLLASQYGHLDFIFFFFSLSSEARRIINHEEWYKATLEFKPNISDIDCTDRSGRNALILAATNGHELVLRALLLAGLSLDHVDDQGEGILHGAAFRRQKRALFSVLNFSKDHSVGTFALARIVDSQRESPLHEIFKPDPTDRISTLNDRKDIVHALIKAGTDPNQTDYLGRTVMHLAAATGEVALASDLIDYAHEQFVKSGNIFQRKHDLLVQIDLPDHKGNTPMHLAAQKGHREFLSLLLSQHVSLERKNNEGETPLWLAAEEGNDREFEFLLERGAYIQTTNRSKENLFFLLYKKLPLNNGHAQILRILFDKFPKGVYKENIRGARPIELLIKEGSKEEFAQEVKELAKQLLSRLSGDMDDRIAYYELGLAVAQEAQLPVKQLFNNYNREHLGVPIQSLTARFRNSLHLGERRDSSPYASSTSSQ